MSSNFNAVGKFYPQPVFFSKKYRLSVFKHIIFGEIRINSVPSSTTDREYFTISFKFSHVQYTNRYDNDVSQAICSSWITLTVGSDHNVNAIPAERNKVFKSS